MISTYPVSTASSFAEAVLIAIVSGGSHSDDTLKAIDSGANDYFVKPAEPAKVVELIKSAEPATHSIW